MPLDVVTQAQLADAEARAGRSLDGLCRVIADLMQAPIVGLFLEDAAAGAPARRGFIARAGSGADLLDAVEPGFDRFAERVQADARSVIVADAPGDGDGDADAERIQSDRDGALAVWLGAPVFEARGRAVGALCVVDRAPRSWSLEDVDRLKRLTRVAVSQARMTEALEAGERRIADLGAELAALREERGRLQRLAASDPITGAHNFHAFRAMLDADLTRLRAQGGASALACLELDHFASVAETFGDRAADEVLSAAAARLTRSIRETTDVVARWRDGKFALLLQDASVEGAAEASERFRRAVSSAPFRVGAQATVLITASCAVIPVTAQSGACEEVLADADAALAAARNGAVDDVGRRRLA